MVLIPANFLFINSLLPLWTSLFISTQFKKGSIPIIPENSLNHPFLLPKEVLILEEQLLYRDEDLI